MPFDHYIIDNVRGRYSGRVRLSRVLVEYVVAELLQGVRGANWPIAKQLMGIAAIQNRPNT